MKKQLVKGEDYYYNEAGFVVLTAKYHLDKGFCCGNGCTHCPYDFVNVADTERRKVLLLKAAQRQAIVPTSDQAL